jgi:hypothetical protein
MNDVVWICGASLLALASIQGTLLIFPWEKFSRDPDKALRRRVDELEYEFQKLQRDLDDKKRYFESQTEEMKLERSRLVQAGRV